MLESLYIQNYAIIDEIELHFKSGLTVITGETGAGKSIMLGALSLILGERADTSILIHKEKKCIVEGTYTMGSDESLKALLTQEGFDIEEKLLIRREVNANGKSRAFINDTPTTLATLQQVGQLLIDLHRQWDNAQLHDNAFQFSIIDHYAAQHQEVADYQRKYKEYNAQVRLVEELKSSLAKASAEESYNQYLYDELEQAAFKTGEIEALEIAIKTIQHQEDIKRNVAQSMHILSDQEANVLQQLKTSLSSLQSISSYLPTLEPIIERLHSSLEELKDISAELSNIDNAHQEVEDVATLEERLNIGFRLLKKHSVSTTDELLSVQQHLSQQIFDLQQLDDKIITEQNKLQKIKDDLEKTADDFSTNRKTNAPKLSKQLNGLLHKVDLVNATIQMQVNDSNELNNYGKDEVTLLLDSNNTGTFLPLHKIASGGELSRIMLCIKSLISDQISVPTLIYDEVDSAISGEAIKQVSLLIKELSHRYQVIVITHQPQMAAKGDQHFYIYKDKTDQDAHAITQIRDLNSEERIDHIAQMIDGKKPSKATLESVAIMMQ